MSYASAASYHPGGRRRRSRLAWVLLVVYATWLAAAAGLFAARSPLAAWVPDTGLVLVFALGAHAPVGRLVGLAAIAALARAAFGLDPPEAVLAGYLAVAAVYGVLREFVQLDGRGSRALLAAVCALGLSAWWGLVAEVRMPGTLPPGALWAWRPALTTALSVLAGAGVVSGLPGLRAFARAEVRA